MLRLLVALDFSDCSREALRSALKVAEHSGGCELVILTVLEGTSDEQSEKSLNEMEEAISGMHRLVGEEVAANGGNLPRATKMHYAATRGVPADEIIASALTHHSDAIVLGTHGRTGLNRLFTGSVAEKVVRSAPCSVLTIRAKR
jgi:nucleotide-binding universal stress UspA family protein